MGTATALHRPFDASIVLSTSNDEVVALSLCTMPMLGPTLKSDCALTGTGRTDCALGIMIVSVEIAEH